MYWARSALQFTIHAFIATRVMLDGVVQLLHQLLWSVGRKIKKEQALKRCLGYSETAMENITCLYASEVRARRVGGSNQVPASRPESYNTWTSLVGNNRSLSQHNNG